MKIHSKKALAAAVAALFLMLLGVAPAWAEEAPQSQPERFEALARDVYPEAEVFHVSLQQCIASAIRNNLDIAVDQFLPKINNASVQTEKGVFDPTVYFNATYFDGTIPLPVRVSVATGGLTGIDIEQWVMTGGVAGALPTGLVYDLNFTSEHTPYSTITDFFRTNGEQQFTSSLTLTQPLLKNFGIGVNTTGIRVAAANEESSVYQLEQRFLETVFEVESAYWELVFAYENLSVKQQALQLAQDLLDQNRIRLKVGVIPPLAVLQSETGVAFREEDLFVAQSELRDARDRLIRVTNLFPEQAVWNVELIPLDEPFVIPPDEYVEGEEISLALRKRPELKQLLKQQEAAELGARYAKNQLLPSLNLNASVGLIGLDSDYDASLFPLLMGGSPLPPPPHKGIDPAFDDLFAGENFQWSLGITFEFPWGSRSERGAYRAANLQVSQLDSGIRSTRQLIIQDTRNALRGVTTNWDLVNTSKETTRFRRESLKAEQKKFDVGISTAHDVLQFQDELAQAEANEKRAFIDYTLSLSNLMRATATLLEARNVQVTANP